MRRIVLMLMVVIALGASILGCTQQERAKHLGGTAVVNLSLNKKLILATWKDDNLWILLREKKHGEEPEKYEFQEYSSYGIFQGKVMINEEFK